MISHCAKILSNKWSVDKRESHCNPVLMNLAVTPAKRRNRFPDRHDLRFGVSGINRNTNQEIHSPTN